MKTVFHRANLHSVEGWFQVLQTTRLCQTAAMTLEPGQATGEQAEAHAVSEQTLLVISGELAGEIGEERVTLKSGDVVIVPAGVRHRFTNPGAMPAVTFNVYCPPEYVADEKG